MEDEIIKFFGLVEKEVQKMEYGSMTINVYVNKGTPVTNTANIIGWRKRKYKIDHKYLTNGSAIDTRKLS